MRSLQVEHTAFNFGNIPPSKSFFDCLTKAITPQIAARVDITEIRNDIAEIICLTIDTRSYLHPQIEDNTCKMKMYISSLKAFYLCPVFVFWRPSDERLIFPWNEVLETEINFWMDFPLKSIYEMNYMLPELYHPVVKSSKNGPAYQLR